MGATRESIRSGLHVERTPKNAGSTTTLKITWYDNDNSGGMVNGRIIDPADGWPGVAEQVAMHLTEFYRQHVKLRAQAAQERDEDGRSST